MMSSALMYLGWTALITVLMWVPAALQMIQGQGLMSAFGNRDNLAPLAPWAERSNRAHRNAVENLVVFTALVLTAHAAGAVNEAVSTAAMVYFWARVLHYLSYTAGIKYLRTGVWTVGWACLLVIAWQILA